jgi:hypothetical protein
MCCDTVTGMLWVCYAGVITSSIRAQQGKAMATVVVALSQHVGSCGSGSRAVTAATQTAAQEAVM